MHRLIGALFCFSKSKQVICLLGGWGKLKTIIKFNKILFYSTFYFYFCKCKQQIMSFYVPFNRQKQKNGWKLNNSQYDVTIIIVGRFQPNHDRSRPLSEVFGQSVRLRRHLLLLRHRSRNSGLNFIQYNNWIEKDRSFDKWKHVFSQLQNDLAFRIDHFLERLMKLTLDDLRNIR